MGKPIITLTTDFGTKDGYAGAVKGVIKRINPDAEVVDISHEIESFDILGAAFTLNNFYRYFPRGTIHLVVVDPGVGSERQPLLIKSENFHFVGPDNGVFSLIFQNETITHMVVLSNKKYFLAEISGTFHARDIFAPVAAYVSRGVGVNEFGRAAKECSKLTVPEPRLSKGKLRGEIIHIDGFGNMVTNVAAESLRGKKVVGITVGRKRIRRLSRSYSEIKEGEIGALMGSSDLLEIALNQGSAQEAIKSKAGSAVTIAFE
ncbi:MAG: SAM-dependent chlorinase/fluorinase [Candidatus Zixiibacteriota bacterium]|nr:MAG: SAM-dependent chlorinase/fluorinase [candidate division Zixibacteria bacterium]